MSEQSTESGGDPEDGGDRGPLSEWLARYDEAMRNGETPPEPRPEAAGVGGLDLDRFRTFLDMLDRTLRPRVGPSAIDVGSTLGDATDADAKADSPRPLPRAIGRFRIEEELGRGGFGIVFRAFDPDMGRWVALKVPKADALLSPKARRRFLGEAHAAAQLDHPNLVPVYEAGEAGSVCYIASAYCEGPTLRAWINDGHAPAEPRRAARMVLALALAIEHMHARGLLHCDLKPGNVLLDLPAERAGEADPKPRVTDFGLARLADAPVGESTAARPWGTPPYMAPEQIEQRREAVGPPTDVYALGGILYELLTGRPPHQGKTTWDLMRAVVAEPPTPPRRHLRSIPRDLDAIALKCLEKRPDRRYPTAAALADDLKRYLDRRPTNARPLGRLRRLARWSARNPTATAVLVMSLATLGVSVSYSIALRRTVVDLNRANLDLKQARADAESALAGQRRHNYHAILALAQQELSREHWVQTQRLLRAVVPPAGSAEPDLRDFAWHYLWYQSRRDRTVLDEFFEGDACHVSAGDGLLLGMSSNRGGGVWRVPPPGAPARPTLSFERLEPAGTDLLELAALGDDRLAIALRGRSGPTATLSIVDLRGGAVRASLENSRSRYGKIATSADASRFAYLPPPDLPPRIDRQEVDVGGRKLVALGVPEATALALTADGRRIVASRVVGPSTSDRVLEIWDAETGRRLIGREVEPIGHALAISPAPGGPIATATPEGEVHLREPSRGDVIATLPPPDDAHRANALAFSADGGVLAAGYLHRAVLWDVPARRRIATIDGLDSWVDSIAFLKPRSEDVALGIDTGEVVVWHTEPMEPATIPDAHGEEVWGVAYAADGGLATVGGDRLLKLWDARTGEVRKSLAGHAEWPSCLASARPPGSWRRGTSGAGS